MHILTAVTRLDVYTVVAKCYANVFFPCLQTQERGHVTLLLSERKAALHKRLMALAPGDISFGVVTNLTSFGAFVALLDFPEACGLVRVSELSRGGVATPEKTLSVGKIDHSLLGIRLDMHFTRMPEIFRVWTPCRTRPNPKTKRLHQ